MATRGEWTKYMDAEHTLALIEDNLRSVEVDTFYYDAQIVAAGILDKHFR